MKVSNSTNSRPMPGCFFLVTSQTSFLRSIFCLLFLLFPSFHKKGTSNQTKQQTTNNKQQTTKKKIKQNKTKNKEKNEKKTHPIFILVCCFIGETSRNRPSFSFCYGSIFINTLTKIIRSKGVGAWVIHNNIFENDICHRIDRTSKNNA